MKRKNLLFAAGLGLSALFEGSPPNISDLNGFNGHRPLIETNLNRIDFSNSFSGDQSTNFINENSSKVLEKNEILVLRIGHDGANFKKISKEELKDCMDKIFDIGLAIYNNPLFQKIVQMSGQPAPKPNFPIVEAKPVNYNLYHRPGNANKNDNQNFHAVHNKKDVQTVPIPKNVKEYEKRVKYLEKKNEALKKKVNKFSKPKTNLKGYFKVNLGTGEQELGIGLRVGNTVVSLGKKEKSGSSLTTILEYDLNSNKQNGGGKPDGVKLAEEIEIGGIRLLTSYGINNFNRRIINRAAQIQGNDETYSQIANITTVQLAGCRKVTYDVRYVCPCVAVNTGVISNIHTLLHTTNAKPTNLENVITHGLVAVPLEGMSTNLMASLIVEDAQASIPTLNQINCWINNTKSLNEVKDKLINLSQNNETKSE